MKWLPLILSLIILFSGIRPWDGGAMCKEVQVAEAAVCEDSGKEHACCKAPAEDESAPCEEDNCLEGCHCYCCTSLIVDISLALGVSTATKATQQQPWVPGLYAHDFNHLIWHPPQSDNPA